MGTIVSFGLYGVVENSLLHSERKEKHLVGCIEKKELKMRINSIEASKYIVMPINRYRKRETKKKTEYKINPVSKTEKLKEYRDAFRKSK